MEQLQLSQEFIWIGQTVLTRGDALAIIAGLVLIGALVLLVSIWRTTRKRLAQEETLRAINEERTREAELRMAELVATQNELSGHLAAMQQNVTSSQTAFSKQLDERLSAVTGRVSQSLTDTTKTTQESLTKLQERLAVIDTAQSNIQNLAQDVVGLQSILQNKQTRGAFGQSRMETIVQDGLPMGAFEFQATLSNGTRPDCTIKMPNQAPALVIDAKFPLEAWNLMKDAETPEQVKIGATQFRRDMEVHIKDISSKYLIAGETQDTAFMFVPSESIFAEVHENFENVVQRAHKARIVIVSPSLLLLSIQVIQAVLKDARMREQAHLIQGEVIKFTEDLSRLDDRVRKLQSHFVSTAKDIDQILISTEKLTRHGAKIESLEFGAASQEPDQEELPGKPFLRAIDGGDSGGSGGGGGE
ncbi:MAG: DNA recombination protein RmuC [Rhizobiaceae bacterium]|nr:DNA recombination protein RmuC [Rhizobiaceae bacterium]